MHQTQFKFKEGDFVKVSKPDSKEVHFGRFDKFEENSLNKVFFYARYFLAKEVPEFNSQERSSQELVKSGELEKEFASNIV